MENKEVQKTIKEFAEKVAPFYKLLDWKWDDVDGVVGVKDIEKVLTELYEDIFNEDNKNLDSSETGGLRIRVDGDGVLYFSMIIDSEYVQLDNNSNNQ